MLCVDKEKNVESRNPCALAPGTGFLQPLESPQTPLSFFMKDVGNSTEHSSALQI